MNYEALGYAVGGSLIAAILIEWWRRRQNPIAAQATTAAAGIIQRAPSSGTAPGRKATASAVASVGARAIAKGSKLAELGDVKYSAEQAKQALKLV